MSILVREPAVKSREHPSSGRPTPSGAVPPAGSPWNRVPVIAMILGCLSLTGCLTRLVGGGGEPKVAGESGSITLSRLERIILNFADRNVTLIADACETIKREALTPEERRRAQHFKLANGTAVCDIVTSPNVLGHLVDLYVIVHLQHLVMIGEGHAARLFGEKGAARLGAALDQIRSEVDHLAGLSMKSARKAQLDRLIQDWRRRNPDVELVSGIRFGNLPELSGKSILGSIRSFFDVLNPLDDTSRSVDETRQLAERAFLYSKRLPTLLAWQAESAVDDVLVKPDVHQTLQDVTRTSGSIDRVAKVIERVPDLVVAEWKGFLAAWDTRQKEVVSTLTEIRTTFAEGREFAARIQSAGEALELTFDALHRVVEPGEADPAAEASRPFDITDYTAAALEISKMVREANVLLTSPAWAQRQEEASRLAADAVGHAERGSRRLVDHLGWRGLQLLVIFFSLLLLYRFLVKRIEGRRGVPLPGAADSKATDPAREALKPS